jgi:thioredoxin reductase
MGNETTRSDVAIIGAGPYGLSIAAHLKALGVDFRIFGNPMQTWLEHMPEGMRLKSEPFASSLFDPDSRFTLEVYCREKGIPYAKIGRPVPLEVFSSYGLEFQKRFVPDLEKKLVDSLQRCEGGFRIRLEDGESLLARRIVVAAGLTHYGYVPPILAALPKDFMTHSSKHHTLDHFKGREVAVVGAGASAIDLAALLHQAGAQVQILARGQVIRFHNPPANLDPSFFDELRTPITGIGPGWKLFMCTNAPLLFRLMPQDFRLDKVKRVLGPAPCWFTKDEVVGKVGLNIGVTIAEAKIQDGRVSLHISDGTGTPRTIIADHVIAATGYRVDLSRLTFIDSDIQSRVRSVEQTPILSSNFESSVPGLYFVGASAANTFGPLLRFAYGAGFASRRLSRHLAKSAARKSVLRGSRATGEAIDRDEVAAR